MTDFPQQKSQPHSKQNLVKCKQYSILHKIPTYKELTRTFLQA